ncbi:MAG: hypothetical protein KAH77_11930 [Thiomargarita sp.]|nr:hypothetical protein [Thiomargarita sp.]
MLLKSLLIAFSLFSLLACHSEKISQLGTAHITTQDDFNSKLYDMTYHASNNNSPIFLSKPGGIIRFTLPLDHTFTHIHTLQLIAEGGLQLDRFLLRGAEYYWDQENNEMLLILQIPSTYLIRSQLLLHVKVMGLKGEERTDDDSVVEYSFKILWQPFNFIASQEENGFFTSLVENHQDIALQAKTFQGQQTLINIFKEDLKKTDVSRVSDDYCYDLASIAASFDAAVVTCKGGD